MGNASAPETPSSVEFQIKTDTRTVISDPSPGVIAGARAPSEEMNGAETEYLNNKKQTNAIFP